MKVIFLDFDGVLINRNSLRKNSGLSAKGDYFCVAALNRIIERTDAKIVVSSTWRLNGLIKVRKYLKDWGVIGEVIGITPDLTRMSGESSIWMSCERGDEIQNWMDTHPQFDIESFVIIDDDSDMAHLKHKHVKTEFEHCLTEDDADSAIAILEDK